MTKPLKYLYFGQFLREKGLITLEDIIRARSLQLENNRKIGELAKQKRWLNDKQIDRILIIQEETSKKFGEIAVEEGYLSKSQLKELLQEQKDTYLFLRDCTRKAWGHFE